MDDCKAEDVRAEDFNAKDFNVLKTIFPDRVSESEYRILQKILYEEYSDRNLAELMAQFTDKPYEKVYNDVLGANESSVNEQEIQGMIERLRRVGILIGTNEVEMEQ